MDIQDILKKHELFLSSSGSKGEKANLVGANLDGANLVCANLDGANLGIAALDLACLEGAKLMNANLFGANLGGANLVGANLESANIESANLIGANLENANLIGANLKNAKLIGANLKNAKLVDAILIGANLLHANLSGVKFNFNPSEWMNENFEATAKGYIVYKVFGFFHGSPENWNVSEGSVIQETVNRNPTETCGCGVNFATLEWLMRQCVSDDYQVYKCLIPWDKSAGIVVPYNTDGKARCDYLEILEKVK